MWLKLFVVLADPPQNLPDDPEERFKYLSRSMRNAACDWCGRKSADAPQSCDRKLQTDRVVSYDDDVPH